jgi:hypothetical protein
VSRRVPPREIGVTGVAQSGGMLREEWLPELQGPQGARVYQRMRDESPIIGACFGTISALLQQANLSAQPYGGSTDAEDLRRADHVNTALQDLKRGQAGRSRPCYRCWPTGGVSMSRSTACAAGITGIPICRRASATASSAGPTGRHGCSGLSCGGISRTTGQCARWCSRPRRGMCRPRFRWIACCTSWPMPRPVRPKVGAAFATRTIRGTPRGTFSTSSVSASSVTWWACPSPSCRATSWIRRRRPRRSRSAGSTRRW